MTTLRTLWTTALASAVVLLVAAPAPPATAVDTPIELSTTSVNFGDLIVGVAAPQVEVQVRNTGASSFGPINMFGGGVGTPFGAFQSCQGNTLAPGASCAITYQFTPDRVGRAARSSNFTISPTANQS